MEQTKPLKPSERSDLSAIGDEIGMQKLALGLDVSPKQLRYWIDGLAEPSPENLANVRRFVAAWRPWKPKAKKGAAR